MLLVLRLQSRRNAPMLPQDPVHFSVAGGTIGRAPGNDLVLDDPGKYISRTHARVVFHDGRFHLADMGSNPSVINGRPLGNGREVSIAAGDVIVIGDYLIEAQLVEQAADDTMLVSGAALVPPPAAPALPLFEPPAPAPVVLPVFAPPPPPVAPLPFGMSLPDPLAAASILGNDVAGNVPGNNADPLGLNLFGVPDTGAGFGASDPLGLAFLGSASDHVSPESQALPLAAWSGGLIPDDYDPLADFLPKAAVPAPVTAPAPVIAPPQPAAFIPAPAPPAVSLAAEPVVVPAVPPAPLAAVPPRPELPSIAPAVVAPVAPSVPVSLTDSMAVPASHPPASHPPAAPASASQDDPTLQALLRGLGLPDLKITGSGPELAELVGAMLREATTGAMQTLYARALTKRESHIEMTMIASQANNPLKFFPDADSALSQMLSLATAGYMKPVRAFGNAFDDLQAHELAVMAGMRAALAAVLKRFDPAAIEQRLSVPTVMDKMLASSRKAKMWDRLVELYGDISREADDDFQRLFGENFARAYEDQVARMRTGRK